MILKSNSLAVVLVGDWNKLYIQPNWIAEHVYEKEEIEIGVNGEGSDFTISYRSDNVIIVAEQSQVVFSAMNYDNMTLENMSKCINNFLEKANTPILSAYGINCDFSDEDGTIFAEVLDNMLDSTRILGQGYEIETAKVSRSLMKNGKNLNIDCSIEGTTVMIHFNEHHAVPEKPVFSIEVFQEFLQNCRELVVGLGYEMEGEE